MDYSQYLLNIPTQKIKYGLSRTYQLLQACGNPEKDFKSIQIVGTNGKGSVSAFLTNILVKSKYKIGWYTSPHLVNINERIKINFDTITDASIEEFIKIYLNDIKIIRPSFFEIMTVMAMWYFKKNNIDFAILETGLGGRLDSVTACQNNYIVFTPISMDHSEILGNNINKIANEKAGSIIRKSQSCISSQQNKAITTILNKHAEKYNIKIRYLNTTTDKNLRIKHLLGEHQKQNALLTKYVINTLNNKKIIKTTEENIKQGINNTQWPGRFQIINNKPKIIFDVCHNEQGIKAFQKTILTHYNNKQNKYLICGFEHNKKISDGLKSISKTFTEIICTETRIRKSMSAKKIKNILNTDKAITFNTVNDSLDYILQKIKEDDILFIIGSHFFAPTLSHRYKNCFAIDK